MNLPFYELDMVDGTVCDLVSHKLDFLKSRLFTFSFSVSYGTRLFSLRYVRKVYLIKQCPWFTIFRLASPARHVFIMCATQTANTRSIHSGNRRRASTKSSFCRTSSATILTVSLSLKLEYFEPKFHQS